MCWKHDWKIEFEGKGDLSFSSLFGGNHVQKVILILKKCSKCSKEEAFARTISGTKISLDPVFVRKYYMQKS